MEGVVPDDLDILLGFNKYLVQAHRCWGPVSVKKEACAHSCQQQDIPTGLMCSCRMTNPHTSSPLQAIPAPT